MTARTKQGVFGARREYNQWVGDQTLEDYALRFTSVSARKWGALKVASTALGAITFLALEAIGGSITLSYGFHNAVVSILLVSVVLLLLSMPISYYSSKYGLDIDLLTRGAGFGYIGSTITSLIYASFTFIFLALEASIMALALELIFGLPLYWGYLVSTLIVIPIVTYGITMITRFQSWTQPFWVLLQLLPIGYILVNDIGSIDNWVQFQGQNQSKPQLDWLMIGAASTLLFSLVAQIGEQADYARFIPPQSVAGKKSWWLATILAGPGWIIIGAFKLLLGSFLLVLAINSGISPEQAAEPTQMYLVAFSYMSQSPSTILALTAAFVVLSQLKINVTNVYAGSIAWSNFFARLTHAHPGRVVWVVFNVVVAIILMEIGIYSALEKTLGIFGIIALSWIGSMVADLVINKPLGLSPPHIEFKRAHLYDINPVGVGAMLISMTMGIIAYNGALGAEAQAFSSFITLALTFLISPLIAWATKGRYYIVRPVPLNTAPSGSQSSPLSSEKCGVCESHFEKPDMTYCPLYQLPICSLCCSLDAHCKDACRPEGLISNQFLTFVHLFFKSVRLRHIKSRAFKFTLLFSVNIAIFQALVMVASVKTISLYPNQVALIETFSWALSAISLIVLMVATWSYLLSMEGRQLAQDESQRQTQLLINEISAHEKTDLQLQQSKEKADAANVAKSRYLERISHELRTPLNSVMGYAQLLDGADDIPLRRRESIKVMRSSSEHLTDLIEGLVDISKIEAGRLDLHRNKVDMLAMIEQLIYMFQIQAQTKNISLNFSHQERLPETVIADGKRLRQVMINLISNAIKFTPQGTVSVDLKYRNQVAYFSVIDTGVGIEQEDISRISEAFVRIANPLHQVAGSGLGLAITQALVYRMGGDLSIESEFGKGSTFTVSLMLPSTREVAHQPVVADRVIGYQGETLSLMVVDDNAVQRRLLIDTLTPLGFNVIAAADGASCLQMLEQCTPKLFMLDISMPNMTGWELAAELRQRGLTVPIVMISAEADEGLGPDGGHHQEQDAPLHNDYLVKPINMPTLLTTLADQLDITLQLASEAQAVSVDSAEAATSKIKSGIKNDPLIVKELLYFIDIGYLDGFKNALTKAEIAARLNPQLCADLQRNLAQLDLTKLHSQLTMINNEI
jgi:signal transduction histidine kinase/CheY-like chemotaxis protein/purine-cytosine permease-like protein|tara:strand:+ start:800 stop:4225 length:3426 start_codon:yes stop_codon:yes gene_type:complete